MSSKDKKMNTMNTGSTIALILLCASVLMQSCGEKEKQPEVKAKYIIPDSLLSGITIDTVNKCPMENAIKLTGMVDFDQDKQVNIFSLVSGNIADIKVQLGDYVTAGQALAVVRSSEMANYSNNLVIAQTNLTSTQKQLDAQKDLFKHGLASSLDVTSAQTAYDQAVAALENAKRVLKINGGSENGEFVIKSPISGFIVQKNVTNNTAVRSDNGGALFVISDLKDVWVQANVYEANIEKVHVGDSAEVRILSEPNKVFKGKVNKILNVLDPTSKVIRVRIVLDNPDYILKPEMYAGVIVKNAEKGGEVLCVNSKALVYENSRYYVLVYHGKGDADIAPVELISTLGDVTYLSSGVKEGDRVIGSLALQIYSELNN